MSTLSHFDRHGHAQMVDVGDKAISARSATAQGWIRIGQALAKMLKSNQLEKGDALTLAKVAGIMAAKRTGALIPLCHPLPLDWADVQLSIEDERVLIEATVKTSASTGVEMEALTAVSLAALTLYDMVKAVDKTLVIEGIHLCEKHGGRSGDFRHPNPPYFKGLDSNK